MDANQLRMGSRNSPQQGCKADRLVSWRDGGRTELREVFIPSATQGSKLKTTKNVCKPTVKESPRAIDDDQFVRSVVGILGKITPENYRKFTGILKTLPINTRERLSAVVFLIYEKAMHEQSYMSTYAKMCQVLSLMSVQRKDEKCNPARFRNLIINKCQREFEEDSTDGLGAGRLKEIEACTDAEKKVELEAELIYDETKSSRRSVGNILLIGELYKLRMLTSPVMMRIIGLLLSRGDGQSLKCLCKLLTAIGKILEAQCSLRTKAKSELDMFFMVMEKIVQERQTVTSVRLLIMDVIELRQKHWVPRREGNKSETGDQVQEMKLEECGACLSSYDEHGRRPHTLPCGHTLCSGCVLLKFDHITCPSCCTKHWAFDIRHSPVSYALEDTIRAMRASQVRIDFQTPGGASKIGEHTSQSPSMAFEASGIDSKLTATVGPKKKKKRGKQKVKRKMQSSGEEQKVIIKNLEVTLQEELNQLHQYRAQLSYTLSEHGRMIKGLEKYVEQHQATMKLIHEEDVKMEAFVEEGKEIQRELKAAKSQLDQISTTHNVIDTTVSIDGNIARYEMWLEHSKEEVPSGTTLNKSYKVLETTKAALTMSAEDTDAPPILTPSGHLNCTIMEAVKIFVTLQKDACFQD